MNKIFDNIEALIGRTPLFRLKKLEEKYNLSCRLYAKLEFLNPTGSIKARAALEMILAAESAGELLPGGTVIEPTSGNTGIALAAIAASRGYSAIIVMPENMSRERRVLTEAYGATVVLTPAELGMAGAISRAEQIKENTPNSFIPSQFDNLNNKVAHIKTTGPEIAEDLRKSPDIFVATVGTGGTLSGIGEYLKSISDTVKVVAAEPAASPLLSGGTASAHKIQGIGANFIPRVLNRNIYDEVITVSDEDAYFYAKQIGGLLGIGIGISSGASIAAMLEIAKRDSSLGMDIVTVFPDGVDRYLSTDLFD